MLLPTLQSTPFLGAVGAIIFLPPSHCKTFHDQMRHADVCKIRCIGVCMCECVCVCEGPLLAFRASRFIQATSRNIAKNCSPGSGFKKCLSHFGPFDFASNDWRLWAWQLGGMSCDGMWKRERGKLAHAFCIPSCSYRVFSLSHIAI